MLVLNGDRGGIPSTEKIILDWLRAWNGADMVGGVAISGCYLTDRRHGRRATETDLVVITPHTCVVVEVKGITLPVGGVMSCPANGPWSIPGVAGSPVHVRANDLNPLNQVREGTFNLKNLAKRIGIDAFVSGLVLIVPHQGRSVTVATQDLPTGTDVLAGSASELLAWFGKSGRRAAAWTAEQAHALLTVLNFGEAVTIAELAAQGFSAAQPADLPPSASSAGAPLEPWLEGVRVVGPSPIVDPPRPRRSFKPVPRQPLPPAWADIEAQVKQRSRERRRTEGETDDLDNSVYTALRDFTPGPVSPPPFPVVPAPRPRWRPHFGQLAAVVLVLMVIGISWLVIHSQAHSNSRGTSIPTFTSSTASVPPPPPVTLRPAPPQPKICYPLQPDC
ncbi:nuclease-related domain-containing protein [Nocardia vaccinii]|uniref:nuclease-related domain-containing protein n=1 Tax=Nocardia vaccinii TaxID=1822 RepID=UPI000834C7E1|nr:nuclease-related domain-containing protein [Nocardia vaccinii]